jgi:hypothetical protein
MHALAHGVGHPSKSEDIPRPIQGQRVVGVEALASENFRMDRRKARIVRLEVVNLRHVGLGRVLRSHPYDDIAGPGSSAIGID